MAAKQITPEVTWAQRSSASDAAKNFLYVTISVPDVTDKDMKLDIQSTGLTFTGYSDSKKATYHVALEFYAEIDPAQSKTHHSARDVELKLQKKELKEEFWPRLLKDKQKVHFLKTDFDKWVDEDEQDGAADEDMMNQFGGGEGMGGMGGMAGMGGMGGMAGMGGMGGMPGMGGMGGDGGFGGLDFSKLGGAGGMPDLSALGGMGGLGGAGDDSDDEDMPELEDETNGRASSSSAGSSKIEEVE